MPCKFQRFDGRAACSSSIAIRHHMDRNVCLFFSLTRHARANLANKPPLKFCRGFHCTTPDYQGIWIERVDHLVEKQAKSLSLHTENLFAHSVTAFGQSPHEFRGLPQA